MKAKKQQTANKANTLNCFTGKKISNVKATKNNKYSVTYITDFKFQKSKSKKPY